MRYQRGSWRILQCSGHCLPTLACFVNVSLTIGEFPACLKVAVVTPVLEKPGLDLNDLTNYRPVSNQQFIGKVLEKVVAEQLTRHLDAHSLRDELQSAYRPRTQHGDRTAQNKRWHGYGSWSGRWHTSGIAGFKRGFWYIIIRPPHPAG